MTDIQVGQQAFVVRVWDARIKVPCPVCFGNKSVELILGDGTHEFVECNSCSSGFEQPTGFATVDEAKSQIIAGYVTGVTSSLIEIDGVEYSRSSEKLLFSLEEAEAEEKAAVEQRQEHKQKCFAGIMLHNKKKVTWSAQYHRNQIRDCEQKLAWHREKLADKRCKEKP